jgi:hypothetical protein
LTHPQIHQFDYCNCCPNRRDCWRKHKTIPEVKYFENKPVELPNYSIQMSNLAASVIRPQIKSLDERITKYNKRYIELVKKLEARVGDHLYIPQLTPGVTRIIGDQLQFRRVSTQWHIENFRKASGETSRRHMVHRRFFFTMVISSKARRKRFLAFSYFSQLLMS